MTVSLLPVPALLMRMSAPPNSRLTSAIRSSVPCRIATSQATPSARTPKALAMRPASARTRSTPRAAMTSLTPSAASPSAIASPMPTLPPVMTATLPLSPRSMVFLSPAGVAAVRQHDRAGHQARGVGGEKQHDRGDLVRFSHARHRRALDPGVEHRRVGLGPRGQRRVDISRRDRVDAHPSRAPFGGERLRQVMHAGLGGVVIGLRLRLIDDYPGHRADIDDRA